MAVAEQTSARTIPSFLAAPSQISDSLAPALSTTLSLGSPMVTSSSRSGQSSRTRSSLAIHLRSAGVSGLTVSSESVVKSGIGSAL